MVGDESDCKQVEKREKSTTLIVELSPEEEREFAGIELFVNALEGLTEPRTLKLEGHVKGRSVVVLIDYEATHNFISPLQSPDWEWGKTRENRSLLCAGVVVRIDHRGGLLADENEKLQYHPRDEVACCYRRDQR